MVGWFVPTCCAVAGECVTVLLWHGDRRVRGRKKGLVIMAKSSKVTVSADAQTVKAVAQAVAVTVSAKADTLTAHHALVKVAATRRTAGASVDAVREALKAGDPDKVLRIPSSMAQDAKECAQALTLAGSDSALVFGSGGLVSRIARARQAGMTTAKVRETIAKSKDLAALLEALPKPAPKAKGESQAEQALTLEAVLNYMNALDSATLSAHQKGQCGTIARKAASLSK